MPEKIAWLVIGSFISAIIIFILNRKGRHTSPCPALDIVKVQLSEMEKAIEMHYGAILDNKQEISSILISQSKMATEMTHVKELLEKIDGKLDRAIEHNN